MFFVTGFLAPIGEESIFRGVIFTGLRKYNRFPIFSVPSFLFLFIFLMNSLWGKYFEKDKVNPTSWFGEKTCLKIFIGKKRFWFTFYTYMKQNICVFCDFFFYKKIGCNE